MGKVITEKIYLLARNFFVILLSNIEKWNTPYSKVRKVAKIRNRYNQVPHMTQDTTWESDKTQLNNTNNSQDVSPFPAGDHKVAVNRRESMTNTRHK